ncbi:MAG: hypothetical protein MHPSP_001179 [Paramarteilia canceri]
MDAWDLSSEGEQQPSNEEDQWKVSSEEEVAVFIRIILIFCSLNYKNRINNDQPEPQLNENQSQENNKNLPLEVNDIENNQELKNEQISDENIQNELQKPSLSSYINPFSTDVFKDLKLNDFVSSMTKNINYNDLKKSVSKMASSTNVINQGMKMFDNLLNIEEFGEIINQSSSLKNHHKADKLEETINFETMFVKFNGPDLIVYLRTLNGIFKIKTQDHELILKSQPFNDLEDFSTNYGDADPSSIDHFKSLFSSLAQKLMVDIKLETWCDDWYNFELYLSNSKNLLDSSDLINPYHAYVQDLALFVATNAKFVRCLCDNLMLNRSKLNTIKNEKAQNLNVSSHLSNFEALYKSTSKVLKYIGERSFNLFVESGYDTSQISEFQTKILYDVYIAKQRLSEIYSLSLPLIV